MRSHTHRSSPSRDLIIWKNWSCSFSSPFNVPLAGKVPPVSACIGCFLVWYYRACIFRKMQTKLDIFYSINENIVFCLTSTLSQWYSSSFDSCSWRLKKRQIILGSRMISFNKPSKHQWTFNFDPFCLLKCKWITFQKVANAIQIIFSLLFFLCYTVTSFCVSVKVLNTIHVIKTIK